MNLAAKGGLNSVRHSTAFAGSVPVSREILRVEWRLCSPGVPVSVPGLYTEQRSPEFDHPIRVSVHASKAAGSLPLMYPQACRGHQ